VGAELGAGPSTLQVRTCKEEDLAAVHELLSMAPEAAGWSLAGLGSFVKEYPEHNLIACKGHEIVGYISGRTAGSEGEVLNLVVRDRHRREGVGRVLVKALLQVFGRAGVVQVFLEVRESNGRGAAFYQKLGFQQIGRREGYYSIPVEAALVLGLALRQVPEE
jgi:ribosomal-protein-alanine acetyltransferase